MNIKKIILNLAIRCFISLVLLFSLSTLLNQDKYYKTISKFLFSSTIDFSYIKSKTSHILGLFNGNKTKFISSIKLNYKDIEKVKNAYKITVDYDYVLTLPKSGVVTFIGSVNELGNTVVIQCDDGVNMWFSHIENINVTVYDYIKEDHVIGSVIDDYFYLIIERDGKYLSYENYI